MPSKSIGLLIFLAALAFVLVNAAFSVHQTQMAIVLQFGEVQRVIKEPGLKFKIPLIQSVTYLDNRVLVLDNNPVIVDVGEQERLRVDAFARYRIDDALLFYQTVRVRGRADERLSTFLDSSIREVVGDVGRRAVISGERRSVMERIKGLVQTAANNARLGVDIIDVKIRRADLPDQNSQAVFNRMKAERQQEAQLSRAEGEEIARRVRAEADRTVTVLLANAERQAQQTRGEGDALRNAIFACAFGADPDFFSFYRSMQAYEKSFQNRDTTMVLSPESEFFRFFADPAGAPVADQQAQGSGAAGSQIRDKRCKDGIYDLSGLEFITPEEGEEAEQPAPQ